MGTIVGMSIDCCNDPLPHSQLSIEGSTVVGLSSYSFDVQGVFLWAPSIFPSLL